MHHHLVRNGRRTRVGLVVESGEPREVHHFAVLIGYGAGAVNPYLAFETLDDMLDQGMLNFGPDTLNPGESDHDCAVRHYIKAVNKGLIKVMSKMGISSVQSYRGAQIFEAVGLDQNFVDEYFTWTATRIGGIGLDIVAKEVSMRHHDAFPDRPVKSPDLNWGGEYQWRRDGEYHLFNPDTVYKLQHATRSGQYDIFRDYTRAVDDQSEKHATLRGLFKFAGKNKPIALDDVESIESIMARFHTGAMSYGSISAEAHETLAIALNRLGGRSNTGEGGEDPVRFTPDANGDLRRSAIKQVASGRFGVTSEYLVNADDLQIKMAQGAKPGEGGQLPGHKVFPEIARVRHSTPGVGLISPPPHHDIYSIEDLAQLISRPQERQSRWRECSVKLVSEVGVGHRGGRCLQGTCRSSSLISGFEGGTGASHRLPPLKHAGVAVGDSVSPKPTRPWSKINGLQRTASPSRLMARLRTGRDVHGRRHCSGADEFGFSPPHRLS